MPYPRAVPESPTMQTSVTLMGLSFCHVESMSEFMRLRRPALMPLIWGAAGGGCLPDKNSWGTQEIVQMLMGVSSCRTQGSRGLHLRGRVAEKSCRELKPPVVPNVGTTVEATPVCRPTPGAYMGVESLPGWVKRAVGMGQNPSLPVPGCVSCCESAV